MPAKTEQLQIRVTPRQKAALKRQAHAAGLDVSSYVLARVLPSSDSRAASILHALAEATDQSFALAELKSGDFSEIRLVEQGQITTMPGPSTRSVCTLSQGAPRGIWSAKSPAGAEHRDCKASATAWIVACS